MTITPITITKTVLVKRIEVPRNLFLEMIITPITITKTQLVKRL